MDRRGFIAGFAKAVVGFSVLPPAETYQRVWRAVREVEVPYWIQVERRIQVFYSDAYLKWFTEYVRKMEAGGKTPVWLDKF